MIGRACKYFVVKAFGDVFIERYSVAYNCVRSLMLKLKFPVVRVGLRLNDSEKNKLEAEQCWRGQ